MRLQDSAYLFRMFLDGNEPCSGLVSPSPLEQSPIWVLRERVVQWLQERRDDPEKGHVVA